MSYRWVMKYLLDSFKDTAQSERASSAARCVAGKDTNQREGPKEIVELAKPLKEKILFVQKYANTSFVNVVLVKPFLHPAGEDGGEAGNNAGRNHQQHPPQRPEETKRKD